MSSQDYSDPKQGGDLSDMAATGTRMPNDAGEMNIIPSVPRPDQDEDGPLGSATLDQAADNANDVARSSADASGGSDVVTGTGDTLPSTVDSKRLFDTPGGVPNHPGAKGHPRDEKASKQKGADQELGAADQADAED